jgi:plastocyanin
MYDDFVGQARFAWLTATILAAFAALCFWTLFPALAMAASVRTQSIQIRNFAFTPSVMTIDRGTTVTWTNGDEEPHAIVATNQAFRSGALDTNGHYSFTFNTAGEFGYFCSLHPQMRGKIIVRAS